MQNGYVLCDKTGRSIVLKPLNDEADSRAFSPSNVLAWFIAADGLKPKTSKKERR